MYIYEYKVFLFGRKAMLMPAAGIYSIEFLSRVCCSDSEKDTLKQKRRRIWIFLDQLRLVCDLANCLMLCDGTVSFSLACSAYVVGRGDWHVCVPVCSVHIRVEEKISLTAGRDGGLQNLEIHGLVQLRITDEQFGRIKLGINNKDTKGIQIQVNTWPGDRRVNK